jgi:hypothetical protein
MPTNLKYPPGEPRLNDPVQRARWYTARQLAMEHVLTFIGQSHWQPNLVLRGSTLLKSWFGERAREPGDLDWVARHSPRRTLSMDSLGCSARSLGARRVSVRWR